MENKLTTIQLSEDTRYKLMKMKMDMRMETYEDVIMFLIKKSREKNKQM